MVSPTANSRAWPCVAICQKSMWLNVVYIFKKGTFKQLFEKKEHCQNFFFLGGRGGGRGQTPPCPPSSGGPETYSWFDYDISKDSVTCHIRKRQNKKSDWFVERCKQYVVVEFGCKNWKKATKKFDKQEVSNCHKPAFTYEVVLCSKGDTAEMLNENDRKIREQNRQSLMIILEVARLLVRQRLPIRGNKDDEPNLIHILKFIAKSEAELVGKTNGKVLKSWNTKWNFRTNVTSHHL